MRWSYPDYLATPTPVIEEVQRWMRDLEKEERERQDEAKRAANRANMRGRRR